MAYKHTTIRIDPIMLQKLQVVAEYENRSLNGQLTVLIRDLIKAYEKEHGEIHCTDQ